MFRNLDNLLHTEYGNILLAKILLFVGSWASAATTGSSASRG